MSLDFFSIFFVVKLFLVLGFLGFAAFKDLRTRVVSNWVWLGLVVVAGVVSFVEVLVCGFSFGGLLFSVGVVSVVSLGLFYGGVFGGADAKALICLGVLFPFSLHVYVVVWVLAVLVGGVYILGAEYGCNFLVNVWGFVRWRYLFYGVVASERWWRKVVVLFLGRHVLLSRVDGKFFMPLEGLQGFTFFPEKRCEAQIMELRVAYQSREEVKGEKVFVWAAPTIPLIAYMFIGTLISMAIVLCFL